MITLRTDRLHWISDNGVDDPADLCAHSPVTCEINGEILASPDDGDWTVSASAIFLLRALERDHTKKSMVGDHIFPCCGHGIYDVGESEVVICGCPSGIDFEIRHRHEIFEITTDDGRRIEVPEREWEDAVVRYSDQVMSFYERSKPKVPSDAEERKGFAAMMTEWNRLRSRHTKAEVVDANLPFAPQPPNNATH